MVQSCFPAPQLTSTRWNLRIVTAGGPSQFVHIGQQVDSPADIPSNTANFFLNSTSVLTRVSTKGMSDRISSNRSLQQSDGKSYLTWGTIPPYGTLFTSVQTDFTPNANLQPLRGSLDAHTEDNSSKFGFTYDGFLQLDGEERYYGLWITNGPRFGGNVAHWKSGPLPPSNSDAVAIRLKRFEPAAES